MHVLCTVTYDTAYDSYCIMLLYAARSTKVLCNMLCNMLRIMLCNMPIVICRALFYAHLIIMKNL